VIRILSLSSSKFQPLPKQYPISLPSILARSGFLNAVEELKLKYNINIAGPTTFTAILNALQMGFKTLAIQKKSADVFTLLGAVKTEFGKFAGALEKTQKKVSEVSNELDNLIGTRTRMIQSKLKSIEKVDDKLSTSLLEIEE
jgi:DNA recombination protein RmuC